MNKRIVRFSLLLSPNVHRSRVFLQLAMNSNVKVIGLHLHTGSGIVGVNCWTDRLCQLRAIFKDHREMLPHCTIFNIGGGFAVDCDLAQVDKELMKLKSELPSAIRIWIEPGR